MRTFRMHSSRPGPGSRRATHVIAERPNRSSFAPCSPQSRRGLATAEFAAPMTRRPALTGAARGASRELRSGRRNASVEQRNATTSIVTCVVRGVCRTANLPLDTVPHTRVGKIACCAREWWARRGTIPGRSRGHVLPTQMECVKFTPPPGGRSSAPRG